MNETLPGYMYTKGDVGRRTKLPKIAINRLAARIDDMNLSIAYTMINEEVKIAPNATNSVECTRCRRKAGGLLARGSALTRKKKLTMVTPHEQAIGPRSQGEERRRYSSTLGWLSPLIASPRAIK